MFTFLTQVGLNRTDEKQVNFGVKQQIHSVGSHGDECLLTVHEWI